MTDDILNIGISEPKNTLKRILKITKIDKKWVTLRNKETTEKIVLHAIDETLGNHVFKISDCYVPDKNGEPKITGIWFTLTNDKITPTSSLAKTLEFYNASVLGDLIGKEVYAMPDKNNYLVVLSCDM